MKIISGVITRPQKVVIYGAEGIGKTTLASQFPEPLFIDTEGGTSHLDVRRIEKPRDWEELLEDVHEVASTPDVCKTLVLDTADWAEQLVTEYVCDKYNQKSIESFGYGKGYTYVSEEFTKLLKAFDCVLSAGINVVITAHAKMRKFEQPDEMGAYDRWELKLSRQVAPLVKEWSDYLFFCNYQTIVVNTETNTKKAQGGKRVIYTTHHPCWDAKSRISLPPVMDMEYSNISPIFGSVEEPAERLQKLMAEYGVNESEVRQVVADRGQYPTDTPITDYTDKFIDNWLIKYWDKVIDMINQSREAVNQGEENNA